MLLKVHVVWDATQKKKNSADGVQEHFLFWMYPGQTETRFLNFFVACKLKPFWCCLDVIAGIWSSQTCISSVVTFCFSQIGSLSNSTCSHVRSSPAVRTGSASISFPVSQQTPTWRALCGKPLEWFSSQQIIYLFTFPYRILEVNCQTHFLNSCVIVPLMWIMTLILSSNLLLSSIFH